MTKEQLQQEIEEEFDKLNIFSAPIPNEVDELYTFVVDISEAKAFLTQAITKAYKAGSQEGFNEARERYVG